MAQDRCWHVPGLIRERALQVCGLEAAHRNNRFINRAPCGSEILVTYSRQTVVRHALVSFLFVLLYLLANLPEIVLFSHIGLVAWYPAIGLVMAITLGISPWYAFLVCFSDALAGTVI